MLKGGKNMLPLQLTTVWEIISVVNWLFINLRNSHILSRRFRDLIEEDEEVL